MTCDNKAGDSVKTRAWQREGWLRGSVERIQLRRVVTTVGCKGEAAKKKLGGVTGPCW